MKTKTKKLIAAVAILVVLATLITLAAIFTAPVNLAKKDMSKYLTLGEGVESSIKISADKTVIYKESVRQAIFDAICGKGEAVTEGLVEAYDTVQIHTLILTKKGEIVSTTLAVETDTTSKLDVFSAGEMLTIGFGTNRDVLLDVENKLKGQDIGAHLLYTSVEKKDLVPLNSFIVVTYSSTASSQKEVLVDTSKYQTPQTQGEDFEENVYHKIISLAIAKIKENAAADSSDSTDGVNVTGTVTVTVYPTAMADEANSASYDDGTVAIVLDHSFDTTNDADGNVTYEKGTLSFTVNAAAWLKEGATPIFFTDVLYEKDDVENETHDKWEGEELEIYVYPVSKTLYKDRIAYDKDELTTDEKVEELRAFIKKTLTDDGVTPVGDDIDELKAQLEKHMYDEIDEKNEYTHTAEEEARDAIWNAIVSKATALKFPEVNVRAYVKDQKEIYKYMYKNGLYPSIGYCHSWVMYQGKIGADGFSISSTTVSDIPASETGNYRNWKEYAVEQLDVETFDAVVTKLYEEGYAREKEMMLTFYLAERLGITIDDAKYAELIKDDAAEWIKEQQDTYKSYWGYAPSFTVEDYEEAMGGEDILRNAHLFELVKDRLYELNKDGITFNEKYPDGKAVANS